MLYNSDIMFSIARNLNCIKEGAKPLSSLFKEEYQEEKDTRNAEQIERDVYELFGGVVE